MLQITPHIPIYLAIDPIDFRCGINKLSYIADWLTSVDPMSGAMFVFTNRSRTNVKVLTYDGTGYWLCQKRLSAGRFKWPTGDEKSRQVDSLCLTMLLEGVESLKDRDHWKKVEPGFVKEQENSK